MALLPLGTGNILARALGVGDPLRAIETIEHGAVRSIDVLRTSHPAAPLALVSISAGFEGRFLERYAAWRSLGRPTAAFGALLTSLGKGAPIDLDVDGETVLGSGERPFSAGLYNTPFYAGGLAMSPEADLADGAGEAVVYHTWRAYGRALGAATGRAALPPSAEVLRRPWRRAHLATPGPLQIDGEPVGAGTVSVWIEPGGLRILGARDSTSSQSQRGVSRQ